MEINELYRILISEKPSIELLNNEGSLFELIPELSVCKGFIQNNDWHIYDVYEHTMHVVDNVHSEWALRLSALFHDIGKPNVYLEDKNGIGHFYGHWEASKNIFLSFAVMHNIDVITRELVAKLIFYHDICISRMTDEEVALLASDLSNQGVEYLFELKRADLLAQNIKYHHLLDNLDQEKVRVLSRCN